MKMDKNLPVRKRIRLKDYDYSSAGYYYVTICTKGKRKLFGRVVGTTALGRPLVELMLLGKCIDETIQIANKGNVRIDKYVVMPNHIHIIVVLKSETDELCAFAMRKWASPSLPSANRQRRSSLQQVVKNIKSYVTKQAGMQLWQERFYDHVIRDEAEYFEIWRYIDENPAKWAEDDYYIR